MMNGVSPKHFLAGGMCREEATSAFLATLIEYSKDFRKRFFNLCNIPDFKIMDVVVEQAQRDITITGDDTFVIIENKIANSSKTKGQLLSYYSQLKTKFPEATIHAVYLAPTQNMGHSEVEMVNSEAGGKAISVAWSDIKPICDNLEDFDPIFSQTGIDCVLEAIRRRTIKVPPNWSEDEWKVREYMRSIAENIGPGFPSRQIVAEGCSLWAYGPISVVADCTPAVVGDEMTPEVVICCELKFRLAGRHEDRKYAKSWFNSLKSSKTWDVYKLDERGNWRVAKKTFDCSFENLEENATVGFRDLVIAIDEGVAREKGVPTTH